MARACFCGYSHEIYEQYKEKLVDAGCDVHKSHGTLTIDGPVEVIEEFRAILLSRPHENITAAIEVDNYDPTS